MSAYAKQWLILGLIVVLVYGLVVLVAFLGQRSMLYFPTHLDIRTRLASWDVGLESFGYAREVASPRYVWLMLHGNGGQAAHRDYILGCVSDADAVFVLEYPGYGFRAGVPSQTTINAAASAAYRELRRRYPGCKIGVIGESLGSGPACFLAHEPAPPDRIVLITPFDTLLKVATELKWYLPVRLILKDRWDNIAALQGYRGRVEVFGAEADGVIPVEHAEALAHAAGAPLTLLPGGHSDWTRTGRVKLD